MFHSNQKRKEKVLYFFSPGPLRVDKKERKQNWATEGGHGYNSLFQPKSSMGELKVEFLPVPVWNIEKETLER